MAEFEESKSTVLDDRDLLKTKFPNVVFTKFSERKDKMSLTNDPNANSSSEDNFETLSVQQTFNYFQPNAGVIHDTKSESTGIGKARAQSSPHRSARPATKTTVASDPFDKILSNLTNKRLYSHYKSRWIGWPSTNKAGLEEEISKYLNRIVDDVRVFLNDGTKSKEGKSDWVYSTSSQVSTIQSEASGRKPDIVIIQRKYANEATSSSKLESTTWCSIRSFGELKSASRNDHDRTVGNHTEYARLCFGHEKARRFVLCFTIKNEAMQLVKFDCSGVVLSHEFNVHKNPHDFLRIIVGMVISDGYYLGLDPSSVVKEGKTWVYLNDTRYEFVKTLLLERTDHGRGTVALLVPRKDGKEMVIKDQWVDRSRKSKQPNTVEFLQRSGVDRIANIEEHQIIHYMVEGKLVKDSTGNDRSSESSIETRNHYRLLISTYGDKLETFQTRKELISAFKDYVETIEELIEKDVVHRDISPGNVILVNDKENPKALRKGYIIDFNYATQQSRQDNDHAECRRTGTYPFMSIAVLDGLDRVNDTHNYYHDLESLFYTFVWTCLTQKGPNGAARPSTDFANKDSPIEEWVGKRYEASYIATYKRAMMKSWDGFEIYVLAKMTKYFQAASLKMLFARLREIIFATTPDLLPRVVGGELVPGKSFADLKDNEKAIRDRERTKVFAEITYILAAVLKLKEIEDEDAAIVKNQQDTDPAEHQQAAGGDVIGIGSLWLGFRVDKPRTGSETRRTDRLERRDVSQSRSMCENSSQKSQSTGKRSREVTAAEAGPSSQTTKRSKVDQGQFWS